MTTEDFTEPITESFLHLSQDVDDVSDSSLRLNTFDSSQLMDLVKKFDNQVIESDSEDDHISDSGSPNPKKNKKINEKVVIDQTKNVKDKFDFEINDDTEIDLIDEKPFLTSHSTPLSKNFKPKIRVDDLASLIQPLLKEEFKDFKESIKNVIKDGISSETHQINEKNHYETHINNQEHNEQKPFENKSEENLFDHGEFQNFQKDIHSDYKGETSNSTPPISSQTNVKPIYANNPRAHVSIPTPVSSLNSRAGSSNDEEIRFLEQEIKNLNETNSKLRLEVLNFRNNEVSELRTLNNQLTQKLDESKKYNQELKNEMDYLNKNAGKTNQELIDSFEDLKKKYAKEIGDKSKMIDLSSLDGNFKKFYTKLNLSEIDQLSKVEMSNLIKNILLTLLLDFKRLPDNLQALTKFLKISNQFIDNVHDVLYDNDFKPSFYINNDDSNDIVNYQKCLNDMVKLIKPNK